MDFTFSPHSASSDAGVGPPADENRRISSFLSTVDMVLLSFTRTVRNRQLILQPNYCQKAGLKINYPKTQIISVGRQPPEFNWFLSNNLIQQVKSFSYLGVQFATNSFWRVHQEAVLSKLDVLGVFCWEFLNSHSGIWYCLLWKHSRQKRLQAWLDGRELCMLEGIQNYFQVSAALAWGAALGPFCDNRS